MDIKGAFAYNRKWAADLLAKDKDYFKKLSMGQEPKIFYIGCSDSRASAEEILGAKPGDLFVHRNVANLVVNIDVNLMSALTYAVDHLKVDDIVVAGHYFCGGVKSAMEAVDLGVLNPWLRNIRNVYRLYAAELDAITDEVERYKRLVELNVIEQCVNIMKTSIFQKAYRAHRINLHAWVYDIETGLMHDMKFNVHEFDDLKGIYVLEEAI